MSFPRALSLLPLALALLALSTGCERRPDAPSSSAASSAASASAEELAAILADPDELSRLRRLTLWAEKTAPAVIANAARRATPKHQDELFWLLHLKLADLHPGADDNTLAELSAELIHRDPREADSAPDLREELLTLAKTSPAAALERIKNTRLHPNKRSEIANDILAQVAAESPERALALLETSPGDRRDGFNAIARAWTAKDPRAALQWALALPPSEYNRGLVHEMIQTWSRNDPGAAVEHISGLPVTSRNSYLFSQVVANWMRESPDESAKWIQAHGANDPVVVKAALMTLGKTHPGLVVRLLQGPLSSSERRIYGEELASTWARTDPAAARAWIDTLPRSPATTKIIASYVAGLSHQNLDAAIAYYQSLPKDIYTGDIAASLSRMMPSKAQALDWLLAQPDNQAVRAAIRDAIGGMSFARPEDMLTMLGKIPAGPRQTAVYQATASRWFDEDPAGAVRWASGLKDPVVLKTILTANQETWIATQPQSLAAILSSLPPADFAGDISRIVENWSMRDPAAATEWFVQNSTLPLPDYRIRTLFENLAEHAPGSLAAKLSALPEGKAHQTALSGAISQMAKTSPQDAAALFTEHAKLKERRALIGNVTSAWAKADPEAAIAWTSTQPASSTRDQGFSQIIYTLNGADPQRALSLAAMASSPQAKDNLTSDAISTWHRQDPKAAIAALDTADMSSERREKLRARLLTR